MPRPLAILAAALLVASASGAPATSAGEANDARDVAAALDGLALAGSTGVVSLAHFRGKVVLLNFFASWCGPCRSEAALLPKLARKYAARGFVVIGVDEGEDAAHVRAFRRTFGATYPIALDRSGSAEDAFGQTALPYQVFLDRAGATAVSGSGPLSERAASDVIEHLVQ